MRHPAAVIRLLGFCLLARAVGRSPPQPEQPYSNLPEALRLGAKSRATPEDTLPLARLAEQVVKVPRYLADADVAHFASRALYDFHRSFSDLLSNRYPIRHADQVRILELDSRTLVAIVEQHIKPGALEFGGNLAGRGTQLLVGHV